MKVYENIGFEFDTNWGSFTIGDEVIISPDGEDNDSYEDYFGKILIIVWVDLEDDGCGVVEPIISFTLEDGSEFPFSLYGYEIVHSKG